jgi:hypothetical protein
MNNKRKMKKKKKSKCWQIAQLMSTPSQKKSDEQFKHYLNFLRAEGMV